ncbi:MAG: hypothetical protein IKZ15_00080 [Clostridia bacterium]|nr:hypothetical protein [Clostridia bacterium]
MIYTVFSRFHTPEVLYLSFPVTWLLTGLLMGACLLFSLRKLPMQGEG